MFYVLIVIDYLITIKVSAYINLPVALCDWNFKSSCVKPDYEAMAVLQLDMK